MSANNLRGKSRTDSQPRLAPQHTSLGVDAEGYVHHFDRDAAVVHRIDTETGARERRSDLAEWVATREHVAMGNAVDVYVHEFIGGEVGWAERTQMTARDVFGGAF
ncbi:hypothetical protein C464_06130 [Halorubrum coriense DSM 10284]|uniref:Uncharacterized protein n=1 Tax=Halorubrum coriense DSM 10284 TaxID=1227466 RepID=M0EMH0_9EURY|nr:hypothetical protein [Halorubrum coriense]ELZ48966.1 hypothetical protein C464_06130 [Halorubrum coriense DSM 10284]QRG24143.1 hypothetical protein HrrHm1_160 [Halorubrum virus Humcor1]